MKLELEEQEINYLHSILLKRPYEEVAALVQKIVEQVNSQHKETNE